MKPVDRCRTRAAELRRLSETADGAGVRLTPDTREALRAAADLYGARAAALARQEAGEGAAHG